MTKATIFSKTGSLWHFHPIGTGVIFTYNNITKKVFVTNESTGMLSKTIQMKDGYKSHDDFISNSLCEYQSLIDNNINESHELMDDPTILDTPIGGVGIDLSILKN